MSVNYFSFVKKKRSLSKYEKRVSGRLLDAIVPKESCSVNENEPMKGKSEGATVDTVVEAEKQQPPSEKESSSTDLNSEEKRRRSEQEEDSSNKKSKQTKQKGSPNNSSARQYRRVTKSTNSSSASKKSTKKAASAACEKTQEAKNEKAENNNQNEKETVDLAGDRPKRESADGSSDSPTEEGDQMAGWELMSEQDNCIIYSKPYEDSGLFQYRVVGYYGDITARDFLDVQVRCI